MRTRIKEETQLKAYPQKNGFIANIKKDRMTYLLILPAILLVLAFGYIPMIGIILAFNDFDIMTGVFGSPWVGFDNFIKIFSNPEIILSIKNTLIYGFFTTIIGFPFPVILALMFNEVRNKPFKKTVQTIAYLPHFISWMTVINLFYSIFSTEGTFTQIMMFLTGGNYEKVNVLMDSKNFLPMIFFSNLWKTMGWESVIFLAAIAGIDPSLYEAATLDGCGKMKQIWNITIPSISPTIIIVLVMALGGLVTSNFEQVFGFQNVFTQKATDTINTVVYREGIQGGKYSEATAFGLAQGLVTLILVLAANFVSKKLTDTSIW